jgi:uncharacterized protein
MSSVLDLSALKVIDTDSHVIEPPDLWTSRMSAKWGELVPHVRFDEAAQEDAWYFGDERIAGVGTFQHAGWHEFPPDHPRRWQDMDPIGWDAATRLKRMEEVGVYAQVLYPNVAGFGTGRFASVREPELTYQCVRAYNDFLVDFASVAPGRFIPVMSVPFWDLDLSLKEIDRCVALGHRGVVTTSQPENWGEPPITSAHWDKLWAKAEELDLSINFHVASGEVAINDVDRSIGLHAAFTSQGVGFSLGNAAAISKLVCAGVCHRFPRLKIVSVESGVGWLPFALAAMDWQWKNSGVTAEHPEYDLLPSEYFQRQIYGCFWFERETLKHAVDVLGPDNLLYETDFPHPTCMYPGPGTSATTPREYIEDVMTDFPEEVVGKLLHGNAARIYHLD